MDLQLRRRYEMFFAGLIISAAGIPTRFGGPYGWSLIYLVIGCLVMGLGISLEVMADVVMLPAEALVRTISRKGNFHFGSVKVVFDCVLAGIAVILALIFFGKLNGVREGTILSALTVGHIVKWYLRRLDPAREWWFGQKQADHRVVRSESR